MKLEWKKPYRVECLNPPRKVWDLFCDGNRTGCIVKIDGTPRNQYYFRYTLLNGLAITGSFCDTISEVRSYIERKVKLRGGSP